MTTRVHTAWGDATVLDEVTLPQRAGEKEFASIVQLLADAGGEQYVRFAYTTDGKTRRGPVTLRGEDLSGLRRALAEHPDLAAALGFPARSPKGGGRRDRRS